MLDGILPHSLLKCNHSYRTSDLINPKRDPSVPHNAQAIQSILAYDARYFRVEIGANMGDELGILEDLMLDDIYTLSGQSKPARLALTIERSEIPQTQFHIHSDTELGTSGAAVHLDCVITLMPERGPNIEALILVEVDPTHMISGLYLVPLASIKPGVEYRLVGAKREGMRRKLAQMACVSFARGTHITLATGAQIPIEDLRAGTEVLTRDAGVQQVTWVGQTTTRAVGAMAPILIRKGALNNSRNLLLSPDHRLMLYQRNDRMGAGRQQILVRARDLVNGHSVVVQDGGFVDYFQILFERHHIIYAEGIAAESLMLDPLTGPALPNDLLAQITHETANHGLELDESYLNHPNAVELLRQASLR